MSNFKPNPAGIQAHFTKIGDKVKTIVDDTVRETADQDVEAAVDTLHERLNAVEGLNFPRDWSQNAVDTLRRGDKLNIKLQ